MRKGDEGVIHLEPVNYDDQVDANGIPHDWTPAVGLAMDANQRVQAAAQAEPDEAPQVWWSCAESDGLSCKYTMSCETEVEAHLRSFLGHTATRHEVPAADWPKVLDPTPTPRWLIENDRREAEDAAARLAAMQGGMAG